MQADSLDDLRQIPERDHRGSIGVITEREDEEEDGDHEDGDQIMAATEHTKIKVAADTGAVAHSAHPRDLPDSVRVMQERRRNFVGAGGEGLKHYGSAKVRMRHANGQHTSNTFQVMNVIRPLHSVSTITDNDHDFLFTKKCGFVVPAGVFDEILKKVKHIAEYPREGGLYVAEMTCMDPEAKSEPSGGPATFAGRGASR